MLPERTTAAVRAMLAAIRDRTTLAVHGPVHRRQLIQEADTELEAAMLADGLMRADQAIDEINILNNAIVVFFDDGGQLTLEAP